MPFRDNLFEEVITDGQIKEQHETVKLLNEGVRILRQKHTKPWKINWTSAW